MIYRVLADIVLILHFCFVLFVIFGGLPVLYRRWIIWLHLPALFWGILVEFLRLPCPLTQLEKYLTTLGGESAYAGDFVEHYISSIIYPNITPQIMTTLGVLLIVFNLIVYACISRQTRQPIKV
ncbi:MAG: DUF2784 domain-containing protein [Pyrinomonadaceae bacterium]